VASELFAETVKAGFREHDLVRIPLKFSGGCDRGQIGLSIDKAKDAEVVVGLCGGKAIDLAKAVDGD
jgi:glycerol dehydrogenase-like iron-containing ADH family enzyme